MKEWRIQYDLRHGSLFSVISAVLTIIAIFANVRMLFLLALLLIVYQVWTHFYLKVIGQSVRLRNPKRFIRLFPCDRDRLNVTIINTAPFPLANLTLMFRLDKVVTLNNEWLESGKTTILYKRSMFIDPKSEKEIVFDLTAHQRAAVKLVDIQVVVKDWFGLGEVRMNLDRIFQTHVIVYPDLIPVNGLEKITSLRHGERMTNVSLNEDLLSPVGTRNYVRTDPFNRIHWKASAKSGQLQTKQLQATNGMTWSLLLYFDKRTMNSADLEREISCFAYLCKYADDNDIPFELYTNIKSFGRHNLLHLPAGKGRTQLAKAYELLARIQKFSLTLPPDWLLKEADNPHFDDRVSFLNTHFPSLHKQGTLSKWRRSGRPMFTVRSDENGAYITAFCERKEAVL
ncbi:MAG TPA: DUF58 domain-containing protein [Bacillales bacterium]|nr:DUF58 domain-containing protein [Bacillales bacterium]